MNLYDAAEAGDLARVQVLVAQGADKEETMGERQATALIKAAEKGHLDITRYLVEQGADMEKTDRNGDTPLIHASRKGHLETVRYLLEQGANRDKASINNMTSLHWAAMYGRLETAKLLMVYGADLNARENIGRLPIDCAHTEEIKQAIRDEPRRRLDHGHKRATEQERHPNAATLASAQQEGDEVEKSNKKPRLDEGSVAKDEEGVVADEDQDSEPSDDEDGN